ncbi:MAG TPA: peptide-methionine (S)-S-oxide reductase MsrA [Thermoanaerobaculales bacterium]|nr:peptide-methionine (S)-S-oxide reductase MsrA [Thermoanaerobaculales bacterium]HPA79447.1 peptide-methionine (S)-S-oxide reductase MsrA [Thermoanaerobaculales bacterium]HQL29459.1 peptide-methionine (S)-S-oxide reductase MsrA [Thermoanaerobaculales bacterium]HQN95104.1 peptide-methionine (S)-S-oxide reductase MsrA [Thermoanaerobaculales bacterium]
MNDRRETAIFGAGCFWGVEEAFRRIEGVVDATVGYAGGHAESPTYREVCSGSTGHAEVVRVVFDPARVSYRQLLEAFWSLHDPTQVDRQGPDVGSQYRSLILFSSPEQEAAARESRAALAASGQFPRPIATAIEPTGAFWPAEEYHQRYLEKRGIWSCHTR